jgi:alpha-glucuronidase
MQQAWDHVQPGIDAERFEQVKMLLQVQYDEAVWWRNACVLYFQTFSNMPLPTGYAKPDHDLTYYEQLQFPYAPGIGGNQ